VPEAAVHRRHQRDHQKATTGEGPLEDELTGATSLGFILLNARSARSRRPVRVAPNEGGIRADDLPVR
jgi:hypothetical protein